MANGSEYGGKVPLGWRWRIDGLTPVKPSWELERRWAISSRLDEPGLRPRGAVLLSSSSCRGERLNPAAARVADTAVSCSSRRVRRRRRIKKMSQSMIAAAARPTTVNTPATAPVFLKNVLVFELSSGKSEGGFLPTWVTVTTPPLPFVLAMVVVT